MGNSLVIEYNLEGLELLISKGLSRINELENTLTPNETMILLEFIHDVQNILSETFTRIKWAIPKEIKSHNIFKSSGKILSNGMKTDTDFKELISTEQIKLARIYSVIIYMWAIFIEANPTVLLYESDVLEYACQNDKYTEMEQVMSAIDKLSVSCYSTEKGGYKVNPVLMPTVHRPAPIKYNSNRSQYRSPKTIIDYLDEILNKLENPNE